MSTYFSITSSENSVCLHSIKIFVLHNDYCIRCKPMVPAVRVGVEGSHAQALCTFGDRKFYSSFFHFVFTDGAQFLLNGKLNKQNSHIWNEDN